MKKVLCVLIAALLAFSLAACEGKDKNFTWTRTGYFIDEAQSHLVSIEKSADAEHPGWYVGIMGENTNGWYIQQDGKTLHGDIASPYVEGAGPYVVTVSEEGTDGIQFAVEKGETYHLKPYEMKVAAFTLIGDTEGLGEIAYAQGNETPKFEDSRPYQSIYIGFEGPEVYTFAARPEEGYKFMKWTKNGVDYSKDAQITFEVTENTELIAVFGIKGKNEAHVDLDKVTTLGQLLGLPDYGRAWTESVYVFAFEQDGDIYRAIADLPESVYNAMNDLDFEDEKYDEKLDALIDGLKVVNITDLTKAIPTQADMDKLIGKTVKELFDAGWENFGGNTQNMEFYFDRGVFSYTLTLEGTLKDLQNFEDADLEPLVVKSVVFNGIGNPTAIQ